MKFKANESSDPPQIVVVYLEIVFRRLYSADRIKEKQCPQPCAFCCSAMILSRTSGKSRTLLYLQSARKREQNNGGCCQKTCLNHRESCINLFRDTLPGHRVNSSISLDSLPSSARRTYAHEVEEADIMLVNQSVMKGLVRDTTAS
jgi:hypothetical protein